MSDCQGIKKNLENTLHISVKAAIMTNSSREGGSKQIAASEKLWETIRSQVSEKFLKIFLDTVCGKLV